MSFPTRRFHDAGASDDELTALQAQYDALAPPLQDAWSARWAGVADADLGDFLATWRAAEGDPLAGVENPEPDPEPKPEPESRTSSPTVASDQAPAPDAA